LRLFSFGGYDRLALAALALVVFGAYDSYPPRPTTFAGIVFSLIIAESFHRKKEKKSGTGDFAKRLN